MMHHTMRYITSLPKLGSVPRHGHRVPEIEQVRLDDRILRVESRLSIDFKCISVNLRRERRRNRAPYSVAAFRHIERLGSTIEVEQNSASGRVFGSEGDPSVGLHFAGLQTIILLAVHHA